MLGIRTRRGGIVIPAAAMPSAYNLTKYASNPVIDVANNANETFEQYVPAPILLDNGDIWCYVKGLASIYAWKSTDGGVTFSLQNGGTAVLAGSGSTNWDSTRVLEPVAIYDRATDTIHLWYKGRDSDTNNWQWGHATAPGSTPTVLTRDPANPILTQATVDGALGATTDLAITDVFMIGSTFHFYGYALVGTRYKMIRATGTTWNDPGSVTAVTDAGSDSTIRYEASVFRMPGSGTPRYGMFYSAGDVDLDPLRIRIATSTDGTTWDFTDSTNIIDLGAGGAWDSTAVYAGKLLKSSTAPYTTPIRDGSGRWRYYFSGYKTDTPSGKANVGLAYFNPS